MVIISESLMNTDNVGMIKLAEKADFIHWVCMPRYLVNNFIDFFH